MRITRCAGIVGILVVEVAACSQTKRGSSTLYSATRLVEECRATIVDYDSKRPEISTDGEHCLGYVQGFVETVTMWQVVNERSTEAQVPLFCLNSRITNEVIVRKIPVWAIEHPEDAKGSAIELLLSMLVGSYRCPK